MGKRNGAITFREIYENGVLKEGISYDSNGREYSYSKSEVHASYEGGRDGWAAFLARKLKYPQTAINKDIEGYVHLKFIVNKDGSVSDIEVQKGIGYGCDKEAIRVLKKSKNWQPAVIRGQTVKSLMTMRIAFILR